MSCLALAALLTLPCSENNLFLVKRLIQRTDMRNPDPAPKRYTSLAWAAVLGHEDTFEFLLTAGHDEEELSKVLDPRDLFAFINESSPVWSPRTLRTTPYSCYSLISNRRHLIHMHPVHPRPISWAPLYAWPDCIMTAFPGSLTGRIHKARLRYTWQRSREMRNLFACVDAFSLCRVAWTHIS